MGFRDEYKKALQLIGQAFVAVEEKGYRRPVLVGGAVVEFYTNGDITSGDFDVTTPYLELFESELKKLGFVHPTRVQLQRGLYHPGLLIGVEIVSGIPFDGKSDSSKHVVVDLGNSKVEMISAEDIIADRMGQYNSTPQGVAEMLMQARYVYDLAEIEDREYLDARIREETCGDYGLSDMLELSNENANTATAIADNPEEES